MHIVIVFFFFQCQRWMTERIVSRTFPVITFLLIWLSAAADCILVSASWILCRPGIPCFFCLWLPRRRDSRRSSCALATSLFSLVTSTVSYFSNSFGTPKEFSATYKAVKSCTVARISHCSNWRSKRPSTLLITVEAQRGAGKHSNAEIKNYRHKISLIEIKKEMIVRRRGHTSTR